MTVVIDVGCARYGGDYSIERLVEEFHPETLYGFDPNEPARRYLEGDCVVQIINGAAGTHGGMTGYLQPGLGGWTVDRMDAMQVPCTDLAAFIEALDVDGIVLKIDAEGAEYDLLEHLIATGADRRLRLAWVEWHGSSNAEEALRRMGRRSAIEASIGCELAEWLW